MSEATKRGRPPVAEAMRPRQVRMTDAEWQQCRALGGAAWIRSQLAAVAAHKAADEADALFIREEYALDPLGLGRAS